MSSVTSSNPVPQPLLVTENPPEIDTDTHVVHTADRDGLRTRGDSEEQQGADPAEEP